MNFHPGAMPVMQEKSYLNKREHSLKSYLNKREHSFNVIIFESFKLFIEEVPDYMNI
jgi:hypothetical protein